MEYIFNAFSEKKFDYGANTNKMGVIYIIIFPISFSFNALTNNLRAKMRLDEYLVSEGYIASRSRAQRYIERGLVKVDGVVATKQSKKVAPGSRIEIAEADQPEGYFKLKGIQEQSGLLHPGDAVLDIGSSAGGFLIYASTIAQRSSASSTAKSSGRNSQRSLKSIPTSALSSEMPLTWIYLNSGRGSTLFSTI